MVTSADREAILKWTNMNYLRKEGAIVVLFQLACIQLSCKVGAKPLEENLCVRASGHLLCFGMTVTLLAHPSEGEYSSEQTTVDFWLRRSILGEHLGRPRRKTRPTSWVVTTIALSIVSHYMYYALQDVMCLKRIYAWHRTIKMQIVQEYSFYIYFW